MQDILTKIGIKKIEQYCTADFPCEESEGTSNNKFGARTL